MAAVVTAPGLPVSRFNADADALSTIRDPRTPGEGPSPTGSGTSTPHPDLNTEVATLSNKLISAINHQTHLDDALSTARQEFEAAQSRVRMLEAEKAEHGRKIQEGELVRREEMEAVRAEFGERDRRTQTAEQDKRRMEQELENLTTTLFEEANEVRCHSRFGCVKPNQPTDGCCSSKGDQGVRNAQRAAPETNCRDGIAAREPTGAADRAQVGDGADASARGRCPMSRRPG